MSDFPKGQQKPAGTGKLIYPRSMTNTIRGFGSNLTPEQIARGKKVESVTFAGDSKFWNDVRESEAIKGSEVSADNMRLSFANAVFNAKPVEMPRVVRVTLDVLLAYGIEPTPQEREDGFAWFALE